jgi:PAS domain S-box-containing protein
MKYNTNKKARGFLMWRERSGRLVIFLMIGVCLFAFLSIKTYANDTRKTRVLVLNSYHKGIPWVYDHVVGIESKLNSLGIDFDMRLEYMDTKNVKYDAAYRKLLYNMYLHKYANYRFDIIISTDDNALNFLLEYHKDLFPDTPIVFGGVNNKEAPKLIDKKYFTGVLELTNIEGTIDLVRRINPETKKIFFVADRSQIGTSNWNRVEYLSSSYPYIQFFRIDDSLLLSEIEDKVKKLSDDSVVLFSMLYRDKTGIIPFEESISRISKASRRPTYTFHSQYIKYGATGGKVLDGKHHGGEVAKIAVRILQGESVSNIPVVDRPMGQYIFDYAQLIRFDINLSSLPKESIILNRPFSFYREYKKLVWITSIFIFILIAIIIALQINVTKRKYVQKELRKYHEHLQEMVKERTSELEVSEEKYRTLYNKSPGMMISVDVSTRKVVECNETLVKETGFLREDIIGEEVFDLYHPDSVEAARKVFKHFLATDEVHEAELQLLKKNGEKIDVLLDVAVRVDKKTGKKYTLSVWRNITERKRLEQHILQAKEEAERANQAKSIFLANMSHEIRTPMNAVLGFTEILKEKEHDQQKLHYIESIHSGGKALLNIINGVLDLSKIEAGKLELRYSAVSLSRLFQEMETVFGRKIRDNGLRFIVEGGEGVPEALILDETRVRQVLINLLGNAVKFTDNGHVRLTAVSRLTDNESRSRVELTLEVEDTGVGISPDQKRKIFDAFEQPGSRRTSKAEGTGLGLAITRNLVEMMNGEISVSSVPGKGSRFRVVLHEVEISATISMKEKEEELLDYNAIAFKPATVLIVDDIDYNREILATYLEGWGLKIIFAVNGQDAIDKARKHHPDLILLDMKMPEMDGYEASDIMNKDEKLKDISVVAVTASAMKQSEEMIAEICDGYLRKPVTRSELVLELMKHLPHTIKETKEEAPLEQAPSAELVLPPPEQIKKLLEAAKMGSITDLKSGIAKIRKMDSKYLSFADMVEAWVHKYQFEEIVEFLARNAGEEK